MKRALRASGVALYLGVSGLVASTLCALAILDLVGSTTGAGRQAVNAAGLGLGSALVVGFFVRWTDRDWGYLDVTVPDRRGAAVTVGGLVAVVALALGLEVLYGTLGIDTARHGAAEAASDGGTAVLAVGVLTSLFLVGPGEELLYRNVVQKHLYGAFDRASAVVVASAVFALMHGGAYLVGSAPVEGAAALSVVFALSLVLGATYAVTENVVVPAAIHGAYNALTFLSLAVA